VNLKQVGSSQKRVVVEERCKSVKSKEALEINYSLQKWEKKAEENMIEEHFSSLMLHSST